MTSLNFLICFCIGLSSVTNSVGESDGDKYKNKYFEGGRLDINIQNLDENIGKVCDRIRKLDAVLTEMYKDPPENGGDEMARVSRTYNKACLDLLYFCKLDKYKALRAAEDIVDHGNPKFMDVDVDEEKIGARFKWNTTEIDGLHILRKNTHEVWYDLWQLYKNLPD